MRERLGALTGDHLLEAKALQGIKAPASLPQALLAAAAFLTPLLGGYLPVETQPLEPGAAPLLVALVQGMNLPILSHAMVALLVSAAFAISWGRNRVVPLPFSPLSVCAFGFGALLTLSVVSSQSRWTTLLALSEWLLYLTAMAAAWSACGRKQGAGWVLGGLAAGCTLAAVNATLEYGGMRWQDPSWRVFGPWMNPNALAGMLLLGLFAALSLVLCSNRIAAFAWGGAAVTMGLALCLTQSKGGILAAALGLGACLAALLAWASPIRLATTPAMRIAGVAAACALLLTVIRFAPRQTQGATGPQSAALLGRVASAAEEHSSAFRALLWRSSLELMRERPLGVGLGTFAQHSARPGLTPQTRLAHNSFLQVGVEAGVVGVLALVALAVFWLREVFRGGRALPVALNRARAGVLGAIAAAAAHSMVDSDLYYFGSGLGFFLLLGVGLSLSADALTPEQLPRGVRLCAVLPPVAATLFLFFAGWVQAVQCRLVRDLLAREPEAAARGAAILRSAGQLDSESWLRIAETEPTSSARIEAFRRAADLSPTPRHYRALARAYAADGQAERALLALQCALYWDPNNLLALSQTMDLHEHLGDADQAAEAARRLVAVEDTPYFRVRATPEFVPTETFRARLYLASRAQNAEERVALLAPATAGFAAFLERTVPRVSEAARLDPTLALGGVTLDIAIEAMRRGHQAARLLERAYRALGRGDDAVAASEAATRFADAERELGAIPR